MKLISNSLNDVRLSRFSGIIAKKKLLNEYRVAKSEKNNKSAISD